LKSIIIVGPTAIGKTNLSISLAKEINGEIIGLDSRQIFDFMPIGTGQPSKNEMIEIKHYLIGTHKLTRKISAGKYSKLVVKSIKEILSKNKVPIICGGSGLYYRALVKGIFNESITNYNIRKKLIKRLETEGVDNLLKELKNIDFNYSKIVHKNNVKRLLRALEIYYITGKGPSENFKKQKINTNDNFFKIYLKMDIDVLRKKIKNRILSMIKNGWIEEVNEIVSMGHKKSNQAMESIGFNDVNDFLKKKINLNELIEQININTRQYAKKQIKWFNREQFDLIIDVTEQHKSSVIKKIINNFYNII
tara:strand:+ start:9146 stop:10066 length:921 start_codon:yes stop_codon:yes gene_type:complete